MSDFQEKLLPPPAPDVSRGTKPRARADQLLSRWGSKVMDADHIYIRYSGHSELWVRAVGLGLAAIYEQQSSTDETTPEGQE